MAINKRTLLLLLLFLSLFSSTLSSALLGDVYEDLEDLSDLEELLSIDEEDGEIGAAQWKPSEAELLIRFQKIVVELNNENAKRMIDENEHVLVLGYAPWCQRSSELMPRFAEAATSLKEMGIQMVMAKLDAERYTKAAKLLGINGIPTILFFVNGSSKPYTGGFTRDELLIWIRKKTGSPVMRLSSVDSAEEFLTKHQIYVIGFFESFEGFEYDEFTKAAASNNEIQFAESNDSNVVKVLFPEIRSSKHFIGVVKSEPERFESFEGDFEEEKILNFIEFNKFDLVTSLTESNSARVYSSSIKLQVFLFSRAIDLKPYLLLFQQVARKFKTRVMFIYVDSAEESLAKPLLTLFGLEAERIIVTAFDNSNGSKYLMNSAITEGNLEDFCTELLHGTLSPFFKSESIPNHSEVIEKVVGKTFDSFILESSKNVFLEVYTPWCIDCEATSKLVENLANLFKGQENIKFARIDASLNEHPKLQIDTYPALIFYPAGDKSNPIKLSKKSSVKDLAAFINEKVATSEYKSSKIRHQRDEL